MVSNMETISSIDRALDILVLLHREERELGVTEIGSMLGVYKSTVHRTLATLENKGFVQQNPENGKYWLGLKLYAIGSIAGGKMPLKQIAQPYVKELAEKFNEVVNVSVIDIISEDYPKSIIIVKGESKNQVLKVSPLVGSSNECYCSAVGKVLLAFSSNDVWEKLRNKDFPSYTKNTIIKWENLEQELKNIRHQGYALDNEEMEIGLYCIAYPILNKKGEIIAAISLTGPTTRIKSFNFEEISKALQETSNKISSLLK